MSLGTLLTLYVIPSVYSFLGARHQAEPAEDAQPAPQPAE
jgi:hypothetical protein